MSYGPNIHRLKFFSKKIHISEDELIEPGSLHESLTLSTNTKSGKWLTKASTVSVEACMRTIENRN